MNLIDADVLKEQMEKHEKFLKKTYCDVGDYEYTSGFSAAKKFVDDAPTIEAEPAKRGRWERSEDEYYSLCVIRCSNCKEEYCFDVSDDVEQLNYHYCPNCGAKMSKEDNPK